MMENHAQIQVNDDEMSIFQEYFNYVMDNEDLPYPTNHVEARDLEILCSNIVRFRIRCLKWMANCH